MHADCKCYNDFGRSTVIRLLFVEILIFLYCPQGLAQLTKVERLVSKITCSSPTSSELTLVLKWRRVEW